MPKELGSVIIKDNYKTGKIISTSSEMPFISVIIDGYNRKEFIIDAVKSVITPDLNEKAFELIILRAFNDNELDKQLARYNAKVFDVKEMTLGEAIAFGVEKSNGEVICFLDDDDMFASGKLSKIESIFKGYPDLGYCHNGQTFCDKNGTLISDFKLKGIKDMDISFSNRELMSAMKRLRVNKVNPGSLYFNLSSISVRRKILAEKLSVMKKITGHIDDLMFFLTLSSDEEVRIINISDALTFYRIHNSMTNIIQSDPNIGIREFRIKQISNYVHSSKVISDLTQGQEANTLAISILAYDSASLYNVRKESKKLIIETLKLLTRGYLRKIEYNSKRRITVYVSFLSFALFYILSKHFPFLSRLSLLFPSIESLKP